MEYRPSGSSSPASRLFDLLGLVGLLLALPTALYVCGLGGAAGFLASSLGALGSPATLLLAFLALSFLRMLFGSSRRALPLLAGMVAGLACFAAVFDFPYLGFVRAAAAPFPAFAEPGPAFFAGLGAILLGSILGQSGRGRVLVHLLLPPAAALAALLVLAGLKPFPAVSGDALSMDRAFAEIARSLGTEYRNPEVEAAVRRVVEDGRKTVAEKDAAIAELTARLGKAEEDRAALAKSAADAEGLGAELEAARKALAELKGKLDDKDPVLPGGAYDRAVQPLDPAVRDFAVALAARHPGPFDEPQLSRRPTEEGLQQAVLVHGAIASSWKYVSDPGVSWSEYLSPARRTLALGLAGDCDDFATLVASAVMAIGGRVRIVHGFTARGGHAWAELWLGPGAAGALEVLGRALGRPAASLAVERDASGATWLVLDWRLGELSMRPERTELAWTGGT